MTAYALANAPHRQPKRLIDRRAELMANLEAAFKQHDPQAKSG
jgi:hypothetical protein